MRSPYLRRLLMEPRRKSKHVIVSALIVLAGAGLAGQAIRADLIYFRKGGEAQLPATIEGNRGRPGHA